MLKNGKGEIVLRTKHFVGIIMFFIIFLSYTSYAVMPTINIDTDLDLSYICDDETEKANIKSKEQSYFNQKIQFICDISGLTYDESKYLLNKCNEKNLDLFLVLGLMRVESNFDKNAVGSLGERGLGQLMENTAKPVAKNLGLNYDPEMLFEPKYNINLFTTQLTYLKSIFKNDLHKALTAYNRGQYGLKRYMASRSSRTNPAESTYSNKVIKYRNKFYNEFKNAYLAPKII